MGGGSLYPLYMLREIFSPPGLPYTEPDPLRLMHLICGGISAILAANLLEEDKRVCTPRCVFTGWPPLFLYPPHKLTNSVHVCATGENDIQCGWASTTELSA